MSNHSYQQGFCEILPLTRFDAKGKPCGKGFIAAGKECNAGKGAALRSPSDYSEEWTENDELEYIGEILADEAGGDEAKYRELAKKLLDTAPSQRKKLLSKKGQRELEKARRQQIAAFSEY